MSNPWDDDPDYTHDDWVAEVINGQTLRGYWEWVKWAKEEDNK